MNIRIHTIESEPFYENSYVLHREGNNQAVVIDPGFEPDLILEYLQDEGLTLVAILLTHGHVDHIAGNQAVKAAFPDAPIVIGKDDAEMLTNPMLNLSGAYGFSITSPPADRTVDTHDVLEFAGMKFEVRFTPGHSPGHVVFVLQENSSTMILGGDVLFRGSIGRTDFPNGSFKQLEQSIRTQLYSLPDDAVVYPGHGPTTTIGHEKRTNEYVKSVN